MYEFYMVGNFVGFHFNGGKSMCGCRFSYWGIFLLCAGGVDVLFYSEHWNSVGMHP